MPIHYLNQSWNIDKRTPRNNRQWHFNWKSYIFIQEKHLNMSSAKRLAFYHSSNTLKCWIRLKILSCICILYHTSTLKCPRLKRFSFQEDRIYLYFTSLISVLLMSDMPGTGNGIDQLFVLMLRRPWWRHQMETFSALLDLCEGNQPVTVGFPYQRPVMWFLWSASEQTDEQIMNAGDLRYHRAYYDVTIMHFN